MADFTQVPVSKSVQEILTAGWSKPAELRIEKGELILRTPDVVAQRDTLLRAIAEHKESEFRLCNKCGYFGTDTLHPGCNYSASPSVRDQALYQAASLIGEEGRDE
jgi:hypothetical protein